MGEVQICRILANRPIFDRILHANRKGSQFGVFWECLTYQNEEKEPDLGLFTLWYCTLAGRVSLKQNHLMIPL